MVRSTSIFQYNPKGVCCVKKEKKFTEVKAIIIKTMEATTPELGHVCFWSPKSSSFSGNDSIVVEEAARNFLSPRPSIKQSGAPNFFVQHDKVEASKLCRYLETCGRALEQFLQRQTSSRLHCLLTQHGIRPTGKGSNIIT